MLIMGNQNYSVNNIILNSRIIEGFKFIPNRSNNNIRINSR